MISFKEFNFLQEAKSANTILSDINEIMTGFFLNDQKWYDNEAKAQYDARVKQALPVEVADAEAKAKVMASEFLKWSRENGYSGNVTHVWWTARPGSMSSAVGKSVDQKKNPTDILVKFSSGPAEGFLGLSAKATAGKGDIGFKNPGIGTVDKSLGLNLGKIFKDDVDALTKELSLPASAKTRKDFLRSNADAKKKSEERGSNLLSRLRTELLNKLHSMNQDDLKKYLITDWMDADISYPPYIKVTGNGNKEPYSATVMDPINNEKLKALSTYPIALEPVGNDSIGVMAGKKKIMKIRFKFESEKMASSMKLSGDPW